MSQSSKMNKNKPKKSAQEDWAIELGLPPPPKGGRPTGGFLPFTRFQTIAMTFAIPFWVILLVHYIQSQ